MIKPNLWITGVPKAGTSSLFTSLTQHPSINGTHPKETFYLLDKKSVLLNPDYNFWSNNIGGWRKFFKYSSRDSTRYYLDGTTHLFFQEESLEALKKNHFGSRFIVMLREPSDRIYSSFVYTRDTLVRIPSDITFARYVSDLFAGNALDYISDPVSRYVLSQELIYSQYFKYLEKWYAFFGAPHVFVGLFEDFVMDNKAFMQKVFQFLEIAEIDVHGKHSNRSRSFRYPRLHKMLLGISPLLPMKGSLKKRLKDSYLKTFSGVPQAMAEDDRQARERLKNYFEPFNKRLQVDLGIDLSRWYE